MAELKVEIGAEIKELQSKLKQATSDLNKFDSKAAKNLNTFSKSSTSAAKSVGNLQKGSANAVPSLQEFSRVIQDAPYGIQGVANNITQLTSQFGYLSKASGGAGAALKAMAGSLMGPAGILLAISAITSLWVAYEKEIKAVISGNKQLAASQKAVTAALNDFYGDSITKINTYVSILEKSNTTEEQRKQITEELIKTVPNLTKEDFKYGNNLDVVRGKIGQYVLAQASRIEADTLVQENSEKLSKKARIQQIKDIADEKKRVSALTKFLKDEGESLKTVKGIEASSLYSGGGGVGGGGSSSRNKTTKEIVDQFNEFANDLEEELKPVQDRINELYGTTFSGGLGSGEKDPLDPKFIGSSLDSVGSVFLGKWTEQVGIINEGIASMPVDLMGQTLNKFDLDALTLKTKLEEFSMQANEILNFGLEDGIGGLAASLGQAIGSGTNVVQSMGAALLGSLGSIMMKYGSLILAFGIASESLKEAMKNPFGGGVAAIVAGAALIAIGGAISAFSSSVAGGGSSNASSESGTSSYSGGSSTSYGGSSSGGGGTYVFEIQGTKLVGVLANTLKRNKNLGGSLSLT